VGEVEGEVETEDGVLVVKRIRVRYRLTVPPGSEGAARRAHDVHHPFCPLYRTLSRCIAITTELEMEATPESD
jgi:uncharacterized OsmC-like protein